MKETEFVTCSHDKTIMIWDAPSYRCRSVLKGHALGVWSVQYDRPTGTKLISCSPDKSAKIWDIKSGKCTVTLNGHEHFCYKAVFDNDAAFVASVGADKVLNYWDLRNTAKPLFSFSDSPNVLMNVDFMPNDQQILCTSMEGEISMYSVKQQSRILFHETIP
jgi:hypothetical protein